MTDIFFQGLRIILFNRNIQIDHEGGKIYINGEEVENLVVGEISTHGNGMYISMT